MLAFILSELAAEIALFAAAGFFLFAIDYLVVDAIYFLRCARRQRQHAGEFVSKQSTDWIAVVIPAWDEAAVIAPMLRSTLARFDHPD